MNPATGSQKATATGFPISSYKEGTSGPSGDRPDAVGVVAAALACILAVVHAYRVARAEAGRTASVGARSAAAALA